jgi:hypothetical protein
LAVAIGTKEPKVLDSVVEYVSVDMVNLKTERLTSMERFLLAELAVVGHTYADHCLT